MLVMGPEWPGKLATLVRSYSWGCIKVHVTHWTQEEENEATELLTLKHLPLSFKEGQPASTTGAEGPAQGSHTTGITP